MDNTNVMEGSIVENSVIGENVFFKGIAKKGAPAKSFVKNRYIDVPALGAIMGDNSTITDSNISPGSKIWPDKKVIREDVNKDIR